jgi:hypothetical protein
MDQGLGNKVAKELSDYYLNETKKFIKNKFK